MGQSSISSPGSESIAFHSHTNESSSPLADCKRLPTDSAPVKTAGALRTFALSQTGVSVTARTHHAGEHCVSVSSICSQHYKTLGYQPISRARQYRYFYSTLYQTCSTSPNQLRTAWPRLPARPQRGDRVGQQRSLSVVSQRVDCISIEPTLAASSVHSVSRSVGQCRSVGGGGSVRWRRWRASSLDSVHASRRSPVRSSHRRRRRRPLLIFTPPPPTVQSTAARSALPLVPSLAAAAVVLALSSPVSSRPTLTWWRPSTTSALIDSSASLWRRHDYSGPRRKSFLIFPGLCLCCAAIARCSQVFCNPLYARRFHHHHHHCNCCKDYRSANAASKM